MPYGCLNYLVDPRNGKRLFEAGVIEIKGVHSNLPLPILFWDSHNVGQPLGVLDFSDEPCRDESINLIFDYFWTLGVETS